MARPFVLLPPPPGGLQAALTEGRRRRRRRHAAAGSLAGAGGLAVVLVVALAAVGGTTDSLRPLPATSAGVPAVSAEPVPSAQAGAIATRPTPSAVRASESPAPATAGPAEPARTSAPEGRPRPTPPPAPQAGGYRTPDLQRSYAAQSGRARLCGTAYNTEQSGSQVGWCLSAAVEHTAAGADLIAEVCRDGTTQGRLSFDTDHEVDLEVRDGDRVLWRWSADRAPVDAPHELTADPGGCWSWRAPWTAVDQRGSELEPGSYLLVIRTQAEQARVAGEKTASFTL